MTKAAAYARQGLIGIDMLKAFEETKISQQDFFMSTDWVYLDVTIVLSVVLSFVVGEYIDISKLLSDILH